MVKYFYTLILVFTISFSNAQNQYLVEATDNISRTAIEIIQSTGLVVRYGIKSFKIRYNTTDVRGNPTVASGLLVLPDIAGPDLSLPLLVYQHGTALERTAVPSNNSAEAELAFLIGGYGYIGILPDYLGLGDNEGLHPYLHADSEAWVAVDMIFAIQEFLEQTDVSFNDQLFITGYSQGGHAAAALQRRIQEQHADQFTITASAPASGPYSMAQLGVDGFVQAEEYLSPGFSAATLISFNYVYEIYDDLEAIFKPAYADLAKLYAADSISLNEFNTQVATALISDVGASIPSAMFQDSIIQIFEDADSTHPIIMAAIDNDLTQWIPQAPTRLYYCVDDETVPAQNSIIAEQSMKDLGATQVQAINLGANLNHIACVTPAALNLVIFFGGFQQILTDLDDIRLEEGDFQVFPNPTRDLVYLDGLSAGASVQLFNLNGQLVRQLTAQNSTVALDVSDQLGGVYLLKVFNEGKISSQKLVIND